MSLGQRAPIEALAIDESTAPFAVSPKLQLRNLPTRLVACQPVQRLSERVSAVRPVDPPEHAVKLRPKAPTQAQCGWRATLLRRVEHHQPQRIIHALTLTREWLHVEEAPSLDAACMSLFDLLRCFSGHENAIDLTR